MNDLEIIDSFLDEREFRNYIASYLETKGYSKVTADDPRVSDPGKLNDNDLLAVADGDLFTVQTFLNTEITRRQIYEVIDDIDRENADAGILVTNTAVSDTIKKFAAENDVYIFDRTDLIKDIGNSKE